MSATLTWKLKKICRDIAFIVHFFSNSDTDRLKELSLAHLLIDFRTKVYLLWREHVFFYLKFNFETEKEI